MPIQFISYKNKQILHCDFKDLKDKKTILDNLDLMVKYYQESTGGLLILADTRGTYTDPEITDRIKLYGKKYFAGKARKRAIIGITGLRKIILKGYNLVTSNDLRAFDSEEEAKEYLIS